MGHYKIVFTDYYYPHIEQERDILARIGDVEIIDCTKVVSGGVKGEEQVLKYASDADAVIVQFASISRRVIEGLKNCRIISRYAIGVDNIDVEAAREKGIVVANVPDYCVEEVSDTAIAHILNCVRKITLANNLFHKGDWAYAKIKPIKRLGGLTIGIIAFGNIARRVAEKLKPYGNTILVYDPYFHDKDAYQWVEFLSLEELLSRSDVISIHVPLNKDTHYLLDSGNMAFLKKGTIIVNTSRGGVINETALAEAIEDGRVASAGLDVLDYLDEEYAKSVLIKYPEHVFITPHMGWYSEEAIADLQRKTALNVYEMFVNGKPLYQV